MKLIWPEVSRWAVLLLLRFFILQFPCLVAQHHEKGGGRMGRGHRGARRPTTLWRRPPARLPRRRVVVVGPPPVESWSGAQGDGWSTAAAGWLFVQLVCPSTI